MLNNNCKCLPVSHKQGETYGYLVGYHSGFFSKVLPWDLTIQPLVIFHFCKCLYYSLETLKFSPPKSIGKSDFCQYFAKFLYIVTLHLVRGKVFRAYKRGLR